MASDPHNVVVLGAGPAGIGLSHYLLRHVLPALRASFPTQSYKLTLVSSSTHYYWHFGSPRSSTSPAADMLEKSFAPIAEGFKEYSTDEFTLVIGNITNVDHEAHQVAIKTDSSETSTSYDTLIIATGSSTNSPVWKLQGDHLKSRAAAEEQRKKVTDAQSIIVAGGGAVGVETAGELGFNYGGTKEITLFSGAEKLLPVLRASIAKTAETKLSQLGVKVKHNIKIENTTETADGKIEVTLSNGEKLETDLYIDAIGAHANSSFLPPSWINDKGRVEVNPTTLRSTKADWGVYSIGDVASYAGGGVPDVMFAIKPLASSIHSDLYALAKPTTSESPKPSKGLLSWLPFMSSPNEEPQQKPYKQMTAAMQIVPIGPKGGVGAVFGYSVPSFMVWMIKSRTFMLEKMEGAVCGDDYKKA
ncbi:MAG: hypothetical protein M1834_009277 [Cirrosporium novae-zelandiae]|nr:MAG: hypothetical protein M1834_009277 [Cirrosporium novae-zelandiae]